MYVSHELLVHCLGKAREISEQYCTYALVADDPLRSVDQLTDICRKYLHKEISIYELDIDKTESPVFGASILQAEDNKYDICHVKNLNYCWQRFVVCKELFHIVLDEEKYRSMSISDHVDAVTVAFPDDESRPSEQVIVELLAEIAAMEFLFPYKERENEIAQRNGNIDARAIAERYKVPLLYVERYLSKSYMAVLKGR